MAKAYVGTARLEPTGYRSPRSRRGRHVRKKGQRKRGTTRRSPRRSVHSEGISYKPLRGEIGMCLRVGRMGPIKRGWVETEELGPERGPLGESGRSRSNGGASARNVPPHRTGNRRMQRGVRRTEANLATRGCVARAGPV